MTTATTLITDSLQSLGVVAAGQSPTANDLSDGLRKLNNMLGLWSLSTLLVPFRTQISKTLDGSSSYTVGAGGDINTTRPAAIDSAYVRVIDVDYPVRVYQDRVLLRQHQPEIHRGNPVAGVLRAINAAW